MHSEWKRHGNDDRGDVHAFELRSIKIYRGKHPESFDFCLADIPHLGERLSAIVAAFLIIAGVHM